MLKTEKLKKHYSLETMLVEANKEGLQSVNGCLSIHGQYHISNFEDVDMKGIKKVPPTAPTFPVLYLAQPDYTDADKVERIAAFAQLYGESGLIYPSAKAVGVEYYRIMLWVSQADEATKLAVQLAQEGIRAKLRDMAHLLAFSGDGSMIKFLLSEDSRTTVTREGEAMVSTSSSNPHTRIQGILKDAAGAAKELAAR